MFDDILNEGDRRQIIDGPINTEDIFIDDDYLFDDDDAQETKNLCDYVLDNVEQNNILFKHKPEDDNPKLPFSTRTSTNIFRYFATKRQEQGKTDQKKKKKSTKNGKIGKKEEQGDAEKNRKKSPSRTKRGQIYTNQWRKNCNYDDGVNIDDLATVGYNRNTEMNLADKRISPTSVAQQQTKKIIS